MNVTSADDFVGSNSRIAAVNGGRALSHGAEVDGQRAIAEVQAAMAIAKRFPRDIVAAMKRIENACARPGLAEESMYAFARGGTDITGPSVTLAKAVAQQWGNMKFGIIEKRTGKNATLAEAYCWDLETNVQSSKVFTVRHIRTTKTGTYSLTDPRDIYETVANNGARRLRACILDVIPDDVIGSAVEWCQVTLKTKCDVGYEAVKKLLDGFREIGVSRAQIEAKIQCKVEAIKPAQMVNLRKIFASIQHGMSTVADWFEVKPAGDGSGSGAPKSDPTADALSNAKGTAPAERPGKKVAETKSESPAVEPPQQ